MPSTIWHDRPDIAAMPSQNGGRSDRAPIDWTRYVAASVAVGVAFVLLDAVVNANPLAEQAYAVFDPIVRPGINIAAAIAIDLVYGFGLTAIFVALYQALPGRTWFLKGLSFGLLLWFSRVVMNAASQWILFAVPEATLAYAVVSGLFEMLVLGLLLGILAGRVSPQLPAPRRPK